MKTLFLSMLLLAAGCSSAPTPQTATAILFDQTDQRAVFESVQLLPLLKVGTEGGSLLMTEVVDQSYGRNTVIRRTPSPPWLLRVQSTVKKQETAHEQAVMTALELYNRPVLEPLGESYVFAALTRGIQFLAESGAERKQMWIFSDVFENTGDFSFYIYQKEPHKILLEYDAIVKALEAYAGNIQDLSMEGVEIHVIHHPRKSEDGLFRRTAGFWERYFKEKGAHIQYHSSLPGHLL